MALTRTEQMARIRGRDTTPELALRRSLWAKGMRYRVHHAGLPGRPDVVFPGKRVAVFIDGCFWHGCPKHYVRPRTREDFWAAKLRANVDRDRRQTLELEATGWQVLRLWEHQVFEELEESVRQVEQLLAGDPCPSSPAFRVVKVERLRSKEPSERRHLEDLRDVAVKEFVDGPRVTAKWKRPR